MSQHPIFFEEFHRGVKSPEPRLHTAMNDGVRTERHAHQRRCRRWGIPWRVELRVLSNAECAAEGMSSAGSFLQRRSAVLQRRSAVLALMAAAATLLPGLAVAQDVYLRAGIDLSRPADTHFTDADCASLVPAALYGCGLGGDGAPLRSVGNVGTVAGVELGLGYAVAPAVRLEALLTYRPRFTFDGHANFLEPRDRQQSVSVDLSSVLAVWGPGRVCGSPRLRGALARPVQSLRRRWPWSGPRGQR